MCRANLVIRAVRSPFPSATAGPGAAAVAGASGATADQEFVIVLPRPIDLAAQGKLECLLTPTGQMYVELPLQVQLPQQA
jgi:hypothetical protein